MQKKELKELYVFLLRANHVKYLPIYQQILLMILLHKKLPPQQVLERINAELVLLGIRLEDPKPGVSWVSF